MSLIEVTLTANLPTFSHLTLTHRHPVDDAKEFIGFQHFILLEFYTTVFSDQEDEVAIFLRR